nr:ATP-binding protein [Cryptomonas sp.]
MIGQVLIGTPGCGKTSFCCLMKKIICPTEETPVFVNLDPGNNFVFSISDINIQELVYSDEIIPELNLGPNGSILYAIEYFEKNNDWFESKLKCFTRSSHLYHFLFDFPGQIELFTHHSSIRRLIKRISSFNIRLIALTLTDSFFFKDKSLSNPLLLICILITLNVELPHLHLLSKSDLFQRGKREVSLIKFLHIEDKHSYNFYKSCYFWSNRLLYDLKVLILEFSTINASQISIFFPESIREVYKKIKNILV